MSYSLGKTADPTVNLKGAGGEADGAGWDCIAFFPRLHCPLAALSGLWPS